MANDVAHQDMPFHLAAWAMFKPYALHFVNDFAVSVALWVFLWLFKGLTAIMPIDGWAGKFIVHIHSAGTVLVFGVFCGLFASDIYKLRKGEQDQEQGEDQA